MADPEGADDEGGDGLQRSGAGAPATRRALVERLVATFLAHYQDSAAELPVDSGTGEPIFVDGGPYDTAEALEALVGPDDVPTEAIAAAVHALQEDGVRQWAPGPGHDDYTGPYDDVVTDGGRVVTDGGRVVRVRRGASDRRNPTADDEEPVPRSPDHEIVFEVPSPEPASEPGVVRVDRTLNYTNADGVPDDAPAEAETAELLRLARDATSRMRALDDRFAALEAAIAGGAQARLGTPEEMTRRQQLREGAAAMTAAFKLTAERRVGGGPGDGAPPARGGMGHNRPPEPIADLQPLDDPEAEAKLAQAAQAAQVLEEEASSDAPDVARVAAAGGILARFGRWLAPRVELAADEFAKKFGATAGRATGAGAVLLLPGLAAAILNALNGGLPVVEAWIAAAAAMAP